MQANKPIDFCTYHALVSPALRDIASPSLRRARHNGRRCQGTEPGQPCDDCQNTLHDCLLAGYDKLCATMSGSPHRTKAGETVHEMETVARWLPTLSSPEDLRQATRHLRRRPTPHEPAPVRAARAQLVHYPLRSIEAKVVRADAQARGASAQPARDLKTAAWAAPLRNDEYAFGLLLNAVLRLRNGAPDPLDIPADLIHQAPHLTRFQAQRLLRDHLEELRRLRPDFYSANVITYLTTVHSLTADQITHPDPEELLLAREQVRQARRTLVVLLDSAEAAPHRRQNFRTLVAQLSAPLPPAGPDLLAWVAQEFAISPIAAERFVRKLVHLTCVADQDWVAKRWCDREAQIQRSPKTTTAKSRERKMAALNAHRSGESPSSN
jgi:hypothetical protein